MSVHLRYIVSVESGLGQGERTLEVYSFVYSLG